MYVTPAVLYLFDLYWGGPNCVVVVMLAVVLQNLDCSEHGVCVLGDTADLPVSCKCDVGYLPPYCTPKPPSSWDSFVAWLKGPAWHVVVFSFGVFMVLVGFAYVAVKWFNGNHAVFHSTLACGCLSHLDVPLTSH